MTSLTLTAKDPAGLRVDAVVALVGQAPSGPMLLGDRLPAGAAEQVRALLKPMAVTGAVGTVVKVPAPAPVTAQLLVLAGVGPLSGEDSADDGSPIDPEQLRRAVGAAVRALAGCDSVALAAPAARAEDVEAVALGALLGAYAFNRYRGTASDAKSPVGSIQLSTDLTRDKDVKAAVARAEVLAAAVHGARDLVNTPPSDLYPEAFADIAIDLAGQVGLLVSVLDDKQLRKDGYGGLTAVGQGSARGPRLVRLEWDPAAAVPARGGASARKTSAARKTTSAAISLVRRNRDDTMDGPALALVGKGITFDSGGLSIKPAAGMEAMKSDMAGAAAVLHTMVAIAALRLPIRVTGWLCLAENMPSGSAQRPSDVITIYGGRTVEVLNTDAEGRLVLADGLVAASAEHPTMIVDVATLTGAQAVALGNRVSAIMSNDDDLRHRLHTLADRCGERFWPMPLPEDLRASMDTAVADIANMGERFGGMLVAGLFLREFVGSGSDGAKLPWAHLDIAGPALNAGEPHGYTPKGGTGVSVRLMLALAEDLAPRA